jgi:uncharacterized membrane protein YfhO
MKREKKDKIPQPQKKAPEIKNQGKMPDIKKEAVKKTSVKKEAPSSKSTGKPALSFFGKYTIFILAGLIIIIGVFVFRHYFNGDLLFFFKGIGSDSINQDYPAIMHKFFLQTDSGLSKYSFYRAMGNAYVTTPQIEPYGLVRTWIDKLFVGINGHDYYVSSRFFHIFFYNILATGIFLFLYLRTINIKAYSALIGALFMSFSGFMMVGAGWGFAGQIFSAVFLLFAFEQLFMKKRWYFFPFAVIYLSGNLFNLYIYSLFLFVYFIFRYLHENGKLNIGFIKTGGQMVLLGAVGILMSAERSVSGFLKMYFSPRIAGNAKFETQLTPDVIFDENSNFLPTVILRFFSSDLLGSGARFKGWGNYFEAPAFYIGILSLIVFTQVFIHLNKKNKILFGSFFLFWILSVFVPPLRQLILANTGDYFRYGFSFFIPFVILFFSIHALNRLEDTFKINIPVLIVTSLVLIGALFFPYQSVKPGTIDTDIRKMIVILIVIYGILLFLMSRGKNLNAIRTIVLLTVVFELSYFSYKSYEKRDAVVTRIFKQDRAGYNDGTMEALDYIKKTDSVKFYRIEKDYQSGKAVHGSLNDAMAQGYFGTTSYFSFNQLNYVRFLEETELIPKGDELATRWISGFRSYPLLQSFASVRYFLSEKPEPDFLRFGYKKLKQEGPIAILKNEYALPLGYTYDSYMDFKDYKSLLYYKITGQALNSIWLESYTRNNSRTESDQLILELQTFLDKEYDTKESFFKDLETKVNAEILEKNRNSVLKFSTVTFENQIALLNGFVYEPENGLDITDFKKIDPNDSSIIAPVDRFSFEKYKADTDKLKQDTLQITDFRQHTIKGKIALKQTKLLFLSIPYDVAWKVKVNGKEEKLHRVNIGFTGIVLPAGDHQIELYYVPRFSKETRAISVTTIILFWSWLAFTIIRKRRKQKRNSDV